MMNLSNRKTLVGAVAAGVVAVTVFGAGAIAVASSDDTSNEATTETVVKRVSTEKITRGNLSEKKEEVGVIDHGDPWVAPIQAQGVVTKSLAKGTEVEAGQPLIWVANKPVVLAIGETPLYRDLELMSKRLKGDDVKQLQTFLVEQGFNDKKRLVADGTFGTHTKAAVKAWQKSVGHEQSGRIDRTQLIFHGTALRVESEAQVGVEFAELSVTGAVQQVKADFDTKSRAFLDVGSTVKLESDEGESVDGTITEVTSTVGDDGTRKLNVTIEPGSPIPSEVERVNVIASRELANDALLVPVRAVLALAGGGYGLEVQTSNGTELREVELGQVVDDVAEITGDFNEGDAVVVPEDITGDDS